mmetsp:Transcript_135910/g.307485  ORF Transcript_135910/g.307485 Transcript_135910/m.307485 type:complete len:211 (-) Transcript_135910:153-785(-)
MLFLPCPNPKIPGTSQQGRLLHSALPRRHGTAGIHAQAPYSAMHSEVKTKSAGRGSGRLPRTRTQPRQAHPANAVAPRQSSPPARKARSSSPSGRLSQNPSPAWLRRPCGSRPQAASCHTGTTGSRTRTGGSRPGRPSWPPAQQRPDRQGRPPSAPPMAGQRYTTSRRTGRSNPSRTGPYERCAQHCTAADRPSSHFAQAFGSANPQHPE